MERTLKNGGLWECAVSPSAHVSLAAYPQSPDTQQLLPQQDLRQDGQVLPPVHHTQACPPWTVAFSAGLGEKPPANLSAVQATQRLVSLPCII